MDDYDFLNDIERRCQASAQSVPIVDFNRLRVLAGKQPLAFPEWQGDVLLRSSALKLVTLARKVQAQLMAEALNPPPVDDDPFDLRGDKFRASMQAAARYTRFNVRGKIRAP